MPSKGKKEKPSCSSSRVMRAYRLNFFEQVRLQKEINCIDKEWSYCMRLSGPPSNATLQTARTSRNSGIRDGWLGIKRITSVSQLNVPKPCTRELRRALHQEGASDGMKSEMATKEAEAGTQRKRSGRRYSEPVIKNGVNLGISKKQYNKMIEDSETLSGVAMTVKVRGTIAHHVARGDELPTCVSPEKMERSRKEISVHFNDIDQDYITGLMYPEDMEFEDGIPSVLRKRPKSSLEIRKDRIREEIRGVEVKLDDFVIKYPIHHNNVELPRLPSAKMLRS